MNGQIAVDLPALYDIAAALDVRVTQLLYLPPVASSTAPFGVVPAFFAGLSQFFLYYYDGRSNQITAVWWTLSTRTSAVFTACRCS